MSKLIIVKNWFWNLSLSAKILVILIMITLSWWMRPLIWNNKFKSRTYQTAQVEKGTLVISVAGSGQISSANSKAITTEVTGVVSKVLVADGDTIAAGDKIAEVDLDITGKQKYAQALASYQNAKNTLASAQSAYYSLQSDLLTKWKTYMDLAQNSTYQNADNSPNEANRSLPQFHIVQDDWLASEAKYKNQEGVATQAQSSVNSASLVLLISSPIIYAPISGTINGLSLTAGSVIESISQKIANIKTKAQPVAIINLAEVDVPKVHIGDKVTLTLDAFVGKTYTGKVASVDRAGVVSSGVTNYPASIRFDTQVLDIYPNMTISANIIIEIKKDVLLVPAAAIQTRSGQSMVQVVKKKSQPETIPVEVGLSSDTKTEIISGLNEGDEVVIGAASVAPQRTGQSSPFSTFRFGGASFGGARGAR